MSDEEVEASYTGEVKKSYKGELIMQKLTRKYEINVEEQEIIDELYRRIQSYLPGQNLDQSIVTRILESMVQDQEQVNSAAGQVRVRKIIQHLKNDLPLEKEAISPDDFNEILSELANARQEEGEREVEDEVEGEWQEEE